MRRMMYECRACGEYCTIRTRHYEQPERCPHWKDCACWIRVDKHKQSNVEEWRA